MDLFVDLIPGGKYDGSDLGVVGDAVPLVA